MRDDVVADEENLYRSVLDISQNFPHDSQGIPQVSSQVFSDRFMRPSVDRAKLREYNPSLTKFHPTDGIFLFKQECSWNYIHTKRC